MLSDRMSQPVIWLGLLLCGYLLFKLGPVMPPFLIAVIFSYLANPSVTYLEKKGLARTVTILAFTLIVVVLLLVFTFLLWPIIRDQAIRFSRLLPEYAGQVNVFLENLGQFDSEPLSHVVENISEDTASESGISQASGSAAKPQHETSGTVINENNASGSSVAAVDDSPVDPIIDLVNRSLPEDRSGTVSTTISVIQQSLGTLVRFFSSLFLIPVIGFYLLRDWNKIIKTIQQWIPAAYRSGVTGIARAVDDVLGQFLRGQVIVMLSLSVIYGVGLVLVGIDFAILIAVVSGLLSFVPFLGTATGLLMSLLSVLSESATWFHAGQVILVFAVGQFIEGNYLTPRLVGDKVGLHPVAVIFALAAGAQLFGLTGLLLALPGGAILWTIIKYISGDGNIRSSIEIPHDNHSNKLT
jgi:predicted PurR-regulated permease PerM